MTTKSKTAKAKSNNPDFIAFHVEDRGEDKPARWNRIGAAWNHEDGNGLNVQLQAIPINFDGKITLRVPSEKDNNGSKGE